MIQRRVNKMEAGSDLGAVRSLGLLSNCIPWSFYLGGNSFKAELELLTKRKVMSVRNRRCIITGCRMELQDVLSLV